MNIAFRTVTSETTRKCGGIKMKILTDFGT